MKTDFNRKPSESFGSYMDRVLREAKEEYDCMTLEEQRLFDEAAQKLGERVHSEIMVSFPEVPDDTTVQQVYKEAFEDTEIPPTDNYSNF